MRKTNLLVFRLILCGAMIGICSNVHAFQTNRVVIDGTTPNPVQALIDALEKHPVVIEFCVDLDLTGHSLLVREGTSLVASPACARGPRKLGPRIFVTDRRDGIPLFSVREDNVRFADFRLEGPTSGIGAGTTREIGIQIHPFDCSCVNTPECAGKCETEPSCCVPSPIRNIEISNMEIYHWSGSGVQVRDNTVILERGRLFNTNERGVRILNSYIHHNRHGDGYGYGVSVTGGGYALIERNVFDENRHGIEGTSSDLKKDFSGYSARENLILPRGGLHCSERAFFLSVLPISLVIRGLTGKRLNCWRTHQIDMHGNKSRWYYHGCCGIAGETILIERNTILYTKKDAIKIRGNPGDKAFVDGNVFTHKSAKDALEQNGDPKRWYHGVQTNIYNPIQVGPNNVFGVRPFRDTGKCSFEGDEHQDTFAATGVTWWAWSPVTEQWRYMNTMPEPFSKLVLGDFDNDGKCDVGLRRTIPNLPPTRYSKSGTGPWVLFQGGADPEN